MIKVIGKEEIMMSIHRKYETPATKKDSGEKISRDNFIKELKQTKVMLEQMIAEIKQIQERPKGVDIIKQWLKEQG